MCFEKKLTIVMLGLGIIKELWKCVWVNIEIEIYCRHVVGKKLRNERKYYAKCYE